MQFNDTTNKQGICQEVDDICDTNSTSYPIASKVRRANSAMEEIVADILLADGRWQFDDTNHTTLPIGTGTLQNGVQSYTFSEDFLRVEQVKVKNAAGEWEVLKPLDNADFADIALEEYFADSGMPTHYDIIGDTIKLYPSPSTSAVTLTNGLKVHFARTVELFTASDTTKEPGFPSPFHIAVAWMTALPHCAAYKKERVVWLEKRIGSADRNSPHYGGIRKAIVQFYVKRNADDAPLMTMAKLNHI